MRNRSLSLLLLFATPSAVYSQEARAIGLKGPVYTVSTEDFAGDSDNPGTSQGSLFEIFDREGFSLETFRYKPDGSIWVHTTYDRKGPTIFGYTVLSSAPPFQSSSVRNIIDSSGFVIQTDTYDGEGNLLNTVRRDIQKLDSNSTVFHSQESDRNGIQATIEVVEATDPNTGLTRQTDTANGTLRSDWLIQRNAGGVPVHDKIVYPDGSYNERETKPDGTVVEDRFSSTANSHTFQTTDSRGNLVEVVQKSAYDYIRCTYSYDDSNRPTGQINYDSAGAILSKTSVDYKFDSHGNWIEKRSINWDVKTDPPKKTVIATTIRSINYYQTSAQIH